MYSRIATLLLAASSFAIASAHEATTPEPSAPDQIRVVSLNIRLDHRGDGENRWSKRRATVAEYLAAESDVAGLQEVLPNQWEHLRADLPDFDGLFRVRHANPDARDEACPIIWRRDRFSKIDGGTYWLSETPDQPGSQSWDSSLPRIVTWVNLRDLETDTVWHFSNLHYDHRSAQAREQSSRLIATKTADLRGPVVVLGDFNAGIDAPPVRLLIDEHGFADTAGLKADKLPGTFNGWRPEGPFPHIDFILIHGPVEISSAAVAPRVRTPSGGWISDHFPVATTLRFLPTSPPHRDRTP